tara:strand:+ start:57 stop:740 length:684 start_codon:yes stop_codon:yes gene_type:complete
VQKFDSTNPTDNAICLICKNPNPTITFQQRTKKLKRNHYKCKICDCIFVPNKYHLNETLQKQRYMEHNNDPNDSRYRNFLSKATIPLLEQINKGSVGIDYGSGPGPTISPMLKEHGLTTVNFDPIFAPDEKVLSDQYDFITCTEAAEHFSMPLKEFGLFQKLLKPNGVLVVMTSLLDTCNDFTTWGYNHDPTHIVFYSRSTMRWIGRRFKWEINFPSDTVTLFKTSK